MNQTTEWIQLALFCAVLAGITKPLGLYLVQVLNPRGRTWLDPLLRPVERLTYRVLGVQPESEHDWKQYTTAMLLFSLAGCAMTYGLLRLQHLLPWNPQSFGPMSPDLAFNTAISFTTNTNWQSYGGESTLSYFSQMIALTYHNFTSAAVGIGIAAAIVRALSSRSVKTLGNFWVDLVRTTYYLLIPASLVFALILVSQGMIQNFKPATRVAPIESPSAANPGAPTATAGTADPSPSAQTIAQGPMASQVAIKMLGTNGGGFTNANAAHPFENPTPFSNFLQVLALLSLASGLTYYLGHMTRSTAHGWSVWAAMMTLFLVGILTCAWAESAGNPIHHALGINPADGNMEGKEVRFGQFQSALFAVATTDASCGAVNSMHDSFTPLGGLVTLFNIQLGEIIFGGVGSGLYGMIVFVILAVFIAGLMVGRTPEYLGCKLGAFDVKMAMLSVLVVCFSTLGFTAWAAASAWGKAALNNTGPHGLTEIMYAYSSASGNNGSAFAGLSANTPWLNTTLGIAMFAGRFLAIVPIMALAGSLAAKSRVAPNAGTFPVAGGTFVFLLLSTILLVGALNFLPALALGPILEQFLMHQGNLF